VKLEGIAELMPVLDLATNHLDLLLRDQPGMGLAVHGAREAVVGAVARLGSILAGTARTTALDQASGQGAAAHR
jgi:hypothetical protein